MWLYVTHYLVMSMVHTLNHALLVNLNDTTDKSSSKALTAAQKYLFIQTFSIPTATNNPEDEQRHNQNNQPRHNIRYASLKFKNHVDEYMRKNNNKLCDVVNSCGLDMEKLTHDQLRGIVFKFDEHLKKQSPT
ncbi:hypothetical protein D3C78_1164520 [compost metagenome]